MKSKMVWMLFVVGLFLLDARSFAADLPYDIQKGSWWETMLVSRNALLRQEAARASAQGESIAPRLGPWYLLGPVPIPGQYDFSKAYPPERKTNRNRGYDGGAENATLGWTLGLKLRDGTPHTLFRGRHVVYLSRTITTSDRRALPVYVDTCGEMAVWLNGKQVQARRGGRLTTHSLGRRNVQIQPAEITLNLLPGENKLLVKIGVNPGPRPANKDPWREFTAPARRPWGTVFAAGITKSGPAERYESLAYREWSQFYFSTRREVGARPDSRALAREELWRLVARDFSDATAQRELAWEQKDLIWDLDWDPDDLSELGRRYASAIGQPTLRAEAGKLLPQSQELSALKRIRQLYLRSRAGQAGENALKNSGDRRELHHKLNSVGRAIADLTETFGPSYPNGRQFASRLAEIEKLARAAEAKQSAGLYQQVVDRLEKLRTDALLANPLLDFDRLLLVRRRGNRFRRTLPDNWASNASLPQTGHDNDIAVLSPVGPHGKLTSIFKPDGERLVKDVDLHFDAEKMLFSMPDGKGRWQVFEIRADGTGLRQVTRGDQEGVDSFDACYLPSGKIVFCSTAPFAGVPCVGGQDFVAVLYRMNDDGSGVRQLCFDQDQDWHPAVLADGRVLYTRWEYTDMPHFFSRLLFHMNPDGTEQKAYYGSNSYWPNCIFYARPVPNHPTKLLGIVSGHHAAARSGELIVFDPAKGRHEADGVVQRIPGRGRKVQPVINDRLVAGSWPKFLHPYPLSEKYFLVACKMTEEARWSIYLVDVFDNMLLLHEEAGFNLLEPIPLRKTARPPVIADKVDLNRSDAVVHITDVYRGPGLKGIPRGTVKKLRVIAYHYAYRNMAADSRAIGCDSSWDTVKSVLGTVPVHEDGSVLFRVPANTPLTVQPLDAEGKAVQLMRSWMTAMPGETLTCVGCHVSANNPPPVQGTAAVGREPSEIKPWYGPARGFSFEREVQPVLDEYCVGCHDGRSREGGQQIADLRSAENFPSYKGRFTPAYDSLHPYVRRPGAESDSHALPAMEYHADSSELVQMLQKGHHNVQLDAEAWDRLITWIDLNVPCHGTWGEAQGEDRVGNQRQRRFDLAKLYAGTNVDWEAIPVALRRPLEPIIPEPVAIAPAKSVACPGWPFDAAEAKRRQVAAGAKIWQTLDLGDGVAMQLVLIPAGEFVQGDLHGEADERPLKRVRIDKPFWMGQFEVTNEQFAQFDPAHDSRYVRTHGIVSTRGYPLNLPKQPVVRVSWRQAMTFCRWLSEKTGRHVTLPAEGQWEYACRAGTASPLNYGGVDADFSTLANLADQSVEHLRDYSHNSRIVLLPRDARFDDKAMVAAAVGSYQPNAWGLYDMHGNAAEWTRSSVEGRKVVRGGSWRDRPKRCRSAFRLSYPPYQGVFNVGFRVVCEVSADRR